jgi:hypothetical protein
LGGGEEEDIFQHLHPSSLQMNMIPPRTTYTVPPTMMPPSPWPFPPFLFTFPFSPFFVCLLFSFTPYPGPQPMKQGIFLRSLCSTHWSQFWLILPRRITVGAWLDDGARNHSWRGVKLGFIF